MTEQIKRKMTAEDAARLADALIAQERAKPMGLLPRMASHVTTVDAQASWEGESIASRHVAGARIGSPYGDLMSRTSR